MLRKPRPCGVIGNKGLKDGDGFGGGCGTGGLGGGVSMGFLGGLPHISRSSLRKRVCKAVILVLIDGIN